MDPRQIQRINKANTEDLHLLEFNIDNDQKHCTFAICGAKKLVYASTLNSLGKFECDCPDYIVNGRRFVCKHICFVLLKVLKYRFEQFAANGCTMVEGDEQYFKNIENYEFDGHIVNTYNVLKQGPFIFDTPKKTIEEYAKDDCPICLLPLDDPTVLKACPSCKNGIHESCVDMWITTSGSDSCVLCRSNVWRHYKQQQGAYISLE